MKENQLKKYVTVEIINLKRFSTAEEKAKLTASNFSPHRTKDCIYGKLTGDCMCKRAMELKNLCAKIFTNVLGRIIIDLKTNASKKQKSYTFTGLEYYISDWHVSDAIIESIINFIKDDNIKTITL